MKFNVLNFRAFLIILLLGISIIPIPAAGLAGGEFQDPKLDLDMTIYQPGSTGSFTFLPVIFSNLQPNCQEITQGILSMFGSSLIAYYPLWETGGDVVGDLSPYNHTGVYEGSPLLNHMPALCGSAPAFDGLDDSANVYSPELAGAFNGQEGTAIIQLKVEPVEWVDGRNSVYLSLITNENNKISLYKSGNNQLDFTYTANGRALTATYHDLAMERWVTYAITWSKSNDRFLGYLAGEPIYPPQSGLGTWSGVLTSSKIGGYLGSSAYFARGAISSVVLLNREATPAEIRQYSTTFGATEVLSVLGDSIARVHMSTPWSLQAVFEYLGGNKITLKSHAVSGEKIMDGMDAQTLEAAADDADIIILALGAVDDNSGDMTALQAEVEENIAELKLSNPRASLFYLNVLPIWTDNSGNFEVNKANIRAAISAACTAEGITCWDTYSTPWITPADTFDGVHPNAEGQRKIAQQVLQRLP